MVELTATRVPSAMAWMLRTATEIGSVDTAEEELTLMRTSNQIQFDCI